MSQGPFRVLCLDGGGIRGVYTVSFLAEIERLSGKRIIDHFDLIVGTSTGGLIALGLGLNHQADAILEFYVRHGPAIFPNNIWRRAKHWLRPKYDNRALRENLISFLGEDTLLGNSVTRLVVPSFDATSGQITCFKTRHHADFVRDHQLRAWEIGMAASAAPTFFPAFESSWGTAYVDGGVWANCPVMVGTVECLHFLDLKLPDIKILSVGTTGEPFHVGDKNGWCFCAPRRGGLLSNIVGQHIIRLFMEAGACASISQASILLPNQLTVVNHICDRDRFKLDDCKSMNELNGLGVERGKKEFNRVKDFFLTERAPFVPVP